MTRTITIQIDEQGLLLPDPVTEALGLKAGDVMLAEPTDAGMRLHAGTGLGMRQGALVITSELESDVDLNEVIAEVREDRDCQNLAGWSP